MESANRNDRNRQVERDRLVDDSIVRNHVKDPAVLAAMRRVPRHRFVPEQFYQAAYDDLPLAIGYDQTISQPSLVALMVESLHLDQKKSVLEVGTGSGYQTAILAELVEQVYTIEIIHPLADQTAQILRALGYRNVVQRVGDAYQGWPEKAPFHAIVVTAAPDHVPKPLLEQLTLGGRLILPVGVATQHLLLIERTPDGFAQTNLLPVRFVPMTGEAEKNGAP